MNVVNQRPMTPVARPVAQRSVKTVHSMDTMHSHSVKGAARPFVVNSTNSPELHLLASAYQPLPESAKAPLPDSVMNGALNEIVDQVIQSDPSNYSSSRSSGDPTAF